jgi:RNA polymerase sigma-70 factor (ECF subfamily)
MPQESSKPSADPFSPQFTTTHWSVVLKAGDGQSNEAQAALAQLCANYWYPLYAYVRRRGYGPEDAQDLTQSFFLRLLEKNYVQLADRRRGKFRNFLLIGLNRFLLDEWDRGRRIKRGGDQVPISLDGLKAEERYKLEPIDPLDATRLYDRRWATTLLQSVLQRLAAEQAGCDRANQFEVLRRFLVADTAPEAYADAAQRLGLSIPASRMAVSRLRERYREMLREEILRTVATPEDAEEEYRSLMAALAD